MTTGDDDKASTSVTPEPSSLLKGVERLLKGWEFAYLLSGRAQNLVMGMAVNKL